MTTDELDQLVCDTIAAVSNDSSLDAQTKEAIISMAEAAGAEPTPGNLRALGVVLDKYAEAIRIVEAAKVVAGASD